MGMYGWLPEDGAASALRTNAQTPGEGAVNLVRTQTALIWFKKSQEQDITIVLFLPDRIAG